jgi:K+-transporting ATPase KdpF subunit
VSALSLIGLALAVAVTVYLLYVMIRPERF